MSFKKNVYGQTGGGPRQITIAHLEPLAQVNLKQVS